MLSCKWFRVTWMREGEYHYEIHITGKPHWKVGFCQTEKRYTMKWLSSEWLVSSFKFWNVSPFIIRNNWLSNCNTELVFYSIHKYYFFIVLKPLTYHESLFIYFINIYVTITGLLLFNIYIWNYFEQCSCVVVAAWLHLTDRFCNKPCTVGLWNNTVLHFYFATSVRWDFSSLRWKTGCNFMTLYVVCEVL